MHTVDPLKAYNSMFFVYSQKGTAITTFHHLRKKPCTLQLFSHLSSFISASLSQDITLLTVTIDFPVLDLHMCGII